MVERISPAGYKLKLPEGSEVHLVFHVSPERFLSIGSTNQPVKIHGNSLDEFQEELPEFHLEDKMDFEG